MDEDSDSKRHPDSADLRLNYPGRLRLSGLDIITDHLHIGPRGPAQCLQ